MPGEIAEMMLDGMLCQGCGDVIGDYESGEGLGYPGYCAGCQPDTDSIEIRHLPTETKSQGKRRRAIAMEPRCCLMCGKKMLTAEGVSAHMRDVHRAAFTWSRLSDDQ